MIDKPTKTGKLQQDGESMSSSDEWHLDRKVPIAFIAVLAIQTFMLGAGWADMNSRLDEITKATQFNEATNRRQWDRINGDSTSANKVSERVARIEGVLGHIARQVDRLVDKAK